MKLRVLVIDDDSNFRQQVCRWLADEGYKLDEANSGKEAFFQLERHNYHAVLLDLCLPRMEDGFEILTQLQEKYPDLCVIIMTAYGSFEVIKKAIASGAHDFLDKSNWKGMQDRIEMNLWRVNDTLLVRDRKRKEGEKYSFDNIIGKSKAMLKIFNLVRKVAAQEVTVLITGENGTGKDLLAHAIHHNSKRSGNSMVEANCAGLSEELLESELFGHERGAFTSAVAQKKGLIERADKSTLFINEIGTLSHKAQLKFLRFLGNKQFERLGGDETLSADVRVIAATNRNLDQAVEKSEFREDLFFRINLFPIHVPPLRERPEDIPLLVDHFIQKLDHEKRVKGISKEAIQALTHYSFPGNVRELEHMIHRAIIMEDGNSITLNSLTIPDATGKLKITSLSRLKFRDAKEKFERSYFRQVLRMKKKNISEAARHAGMDRRNFRDKIHKYFDSEDSAKNHSNS